MGFIAKILLVVIVTGVAWYGFRWWRRMIDGDQRVGGAPARPKTPRWTKEPTEAIDDMAACTTCGAFVAPSAGRCARHDCPRA